ncbi:hypothetical protein K502DRAFT_349127 [Neoconidiobolus thromboides FSU 785]|nr:hypothetical protein K502DRAFT_349127 [Neoconidiobolus thromboides FSU 785]
MQLKKNKSPPVAPSIGSTILTIITNQLLFPFLSGFGWGMFINLIACLGIGTRFLYPKSMAMSRAIGKRVRAYINEFFCMVIE